MSSATTAGDDGLDFPCSVDGGWLLDPGHGLCDLLRYGSHIVGRLRRLLCGSVFS